MEDTDNSGCQIGFIRLNDNYNTFLKDLDERIQSTKYKYVKNKCLNYLINFIICDVFTEKEPNWVDKTLFYDNSLNYISKNYSRIIIYKYIPNEIFIQINGLIKLNKLLDNYNFECVDLNVWKKDFPVNIKYKEGNNNLLLEHIIKYRKNVYMEEFKKNLKNNCAQLDENTINKINSYVTEKINEINLQQIQNLYYDLIDNKKINTNMKLEKYIVSNCLDVNNKNSETIYNSKIVENKSTQYKLLDRKLFMDCEIADIYDMSNNLLFHNKKSNDLRVLSSQILTGAIILNDINFKNNFISKFKLNNNLDNFYYVFGVIKTKKIAPKDIFSVGLACLILEQLNINYWIDEIEYIDDRNKENNDDNEVNNKGDITAKTKKVTKQTANATKRKSTIKTNKNNKTNNEV